MPTITSDESDTKTNFLKYFREKSSLAYLSPALDDSVNMMQETLFQFKMPNFFCRKIKETLALSLIKVTVLTSFMLSRITEYLRRVHQILK